MRTITRAAAVLAGAATLGLGLVAAPATAAVGDAPTVNLVNDTFRAGSWGEGVQFIVTDVPEEAEQVTLSVGSMGENGGGLVAEPVVAEQQGDGSYTGTVLPEGNTPVAPDAGGYPTYTANASYTYLDENGNEQFVSGEAIELVIQEGLSVTGPNEATVAELADGVALQFAGFQPGETVTGQIEYMNLDAGEYGEWETIGDFSATLGANGSGEGILTIIGASVDNTFRVSASGEEGTVYHYITAVEGDDDGGEDEGGNGDETPAPPAPDAPTKPERVDTGA